MGQIWDGRPAVPPDLGQICPLTWYFLVRPLGFEPRTCGLRVRCSAVELEAHRPGRSQDPSSVGALACPQLFDWVTDGARTRDIQYHKLALYQLNYGHHVGRSVCHIGAALPLVVSPTVAWVPSNGHDGFRGEVGL